jgi:hypothetical protein
VIGMRRLWLGCAVLGALLAPATARADSVTDWNETASTAIVAVAGQPPPVAVLSFAMVHGAVYDAIDGGRRPRPASDDAAVAAAAFGVLSGLFPTQLTTLQARYDASLAAIPDRPAKDRGIADGEAAAAAMLAARAGDGRGDPFTFTIGTTPGAWRPLTPVALDPAPWVANVRPFVIPDVERLRTDPPNALTSRAYARDFNEIKSVGALHSTTRTPDETDAAIFWQEHVFALWNRIFRTIATSRRLDVHDSARMFALADTAAADAAIGCWDNKYHWNFWRPITAIREAAGDGNPATEPDTTWTPLFDPSTPVVAGQAPLVTPPFPDHPSGHNCAAGAIVRILQKFFGTDRIGFSATSAKSGTTRSFARLSDALRENIDARVWAGIHFRAADIDGARLGEKVARYVYRHSFRR